MREGAVNTRRARRGAVTVRMLRRSAACLLAAASCCSKPPQVESPQDASSACTDMTPVSLATIGAPVGAVRVDDRGTVYFLDAYPFVSPNTTTLFAVGRDGGTVRKVTSAPQITQFVVSPSAVYFVDGAGLETAPTTGGTPVLFSPAANGMSAGALSVGDSYAYVVMSRASSCTAQLERIPLANAMAPSIAASGLDCRVGWSASDDENFYWTSAPSVGARVFRVPGAGGAPVLLADDSKGRGVRGLGVSGEDLYFGVTGACVTPVGGPPCGPPEPDAGAVMRVPIAGGAATTVATDSDVAGVAVDSKYAYWVNPEDSVKYAAIGTEASPNVAHTLAKDSSASGGPVVDGTYVYWASGNAVERACKPQ